MLNNRLYYLEEPKLKFAFNQSAEDSRDGLTLFGPYEKNSGTIRAGVIGTEKGLEYYRSFVYQINKPIFTNSSGRPFFPGFKSVFGIEWPANPAATIILSQRDLDTLLAMPNLKERTYNLVSLYLDAIKRYIEDEETVVDIWYVVVPNMVLTLAIISGFIRSPHFSSALFRPELRRGLSSQIIEPAGNLFLSKAL